METSAQYKPIRAIIGLGNPGTTYYYTRHSIGFRVIDELARVAQATWRSRDTMEYAEAFIDGNPVLLVKPTTFMNSSGAVIPALAKQGIKADALLVIHDELEQPFGKLTVKLGGSARGHNGLRSLIASCGDGFTRLRCGIGRPEDKSDVATYVLQRFAESEDQVDSMVTAAVTKLIELVKTRAHG